ncbi:hypothetical protein AVEN_188011-1 [Araneus ventricosus]|uniref:Uncharacterized protein n=1 Tax=Araneus ventricosus TaxID=182803 RepID=A0A4Y2HQ00_ARAVE|nr:hypothetical protein AVEN_188011-1 [Araneus ventricosus]
MENRFALGDLARVWFAIGDICARLTENRLAWRLGIAFGSQLATWLFTIGDICAQLTENRFAFWLFTIGDICARLTENRFALDDLARVWFTIGDICPK